MATPTVRKELFFEIPSPPIIPELYNEEDVPAFESREVGIESASSDHVIQAAQHTPAAGESCECHAVVPGSSVMAARAEPPVDEKVAVAVAVVVAVDRSAVAAVVAGPLLVGWLPWSHMNQWHIDSLQLWALPSL